MHKLYADERIFDPKVLATQKFTVNLALNVAQEHRRGGGLFLCQRERTTAPPGPGEGLSNHGCPQPLTIGRHEGTVAIIVGAGPSLDKNVHLLGELPTDDFTVLASDGALPRLLKDKVQLDGVITCEMDGAHVRPDHFCTEWLLEGIEDQTCRIPLYASAWANHEFIKRWRGPIEWYIDFGWMYARYWGAHSDLFPRGLPVLEPAMPASGIHAVVVAQALGCREAVLIGCDFGVPTVGKHHCDGYPLVGERASEDGVHSSFQEMLRGFYVHAHGDFRFPVTNCTEGGFLGNSFRCNGHGGRALSFARKLDELKRGLTFSGEDYGP